MKNIWIPFLTLVMIVSSCSKDFEDDHLNQQISSVSLKGKINKVAICHYDEVTDTWKTLNVSENSLKGHLNHGDVVGECKTSPYDYLPQEGLVAWFPFNGNTIDESGNGNDGNPMGSASLSTDRFNNLNSSYNFSGTRDSYISVIQNSSFSNFQEGLTLSLWCIYQDHPSNSRIIEIGNTDGGSKGFTVSVNSSINKWVANIGSSITGGLGSPIPNDEVVENTWSHLVLAFNFITGNSKIYVNGVLVGHYTPAPNSYINNFGVFDLSDRIFNIGRKTESAFDPWKGSVDDVGIWNRPLTTQEIENIYNSSKN